MTLRDEVVATMSYDPATQSPSDRKPDFCGDQEIFPQNDQEFEELWQHHFAPRHA